MERNYLYLVPNTPLDAVYRRFFPEGFPAMSLPGGEPDLYKRSDGAVYWKLDLAAMTDLQRAALRDFYHYTVRVRRVDYRLDLQSGLLPYQEFIVEAGLSESYTSYMTVEPPDLAIAYCEDAPALARYCVPQEYWQHLITKFLAAKFRYLEQQQEQALQAARLNGLEQHQTHSLEPPHFDQALPPNLKSSKPPGATEKPPGATDFTGTGYW